MSSESRIVSQKNQLLDTNVVIRFLTNDDQRLANQAKEIFENAPSASLVISDVVMLEIVYVLLNVYHLSKSSLIEKISLLLTFKPFVVSGKLMDKTLLIFSQQNISFVDAYLLARVKLGINSGLVTFDRKLKKLAN